MIAARVFALSLASLLLPLSGCGSTLRNVTKTEYEVQLAATGEGIRIAGQDLGRALTVADLDGGVAGLQKAESVKAADTMLAARQILGRVGRSAAIKEGQAALRELNRLGYEGCAARP